MMKLASIFLFTPTLLMAQNLVSNPGFECGVDQCDFTLLVELYPSFVCNWEIPTNGTSDIFSTQLSNKGCWALMPNSETGDPKNPPIGSQTPLSGNRFAGILTYTKPVGEPNDTASYREYLMAPLSKPLEPGRYYCGEMYVSLAEQPKYATNNLGMYFSDEHIRIHSWAPIKGAPQINSEEPILNDKSWVKVFGGFKATSAARYVIIGNFYNDAQTMLVDKGGKFPESHSYIGAYYFIDNVSVKELGIPALTFSGSTTICEGFNTNITATWNGESVHWKSLSDTTMSWTGPSLRVKPLQTTSYRVTGKTCKLEFSDTITVTVLPNPAVALGNDTTLCAGEQLTVDAGPGYVNYTWQDNSSGRFLEISKAGTYSVTTKYHNGCTRSDALIVTVKDVPEVDLGSDTVVCTNYFPLQAGEGQPEYEWSTGAIDSHILPDQPGVYWVRVENECGEAVDSIHLYSFKDIFIPNVITLNNDDLNDQFQVKGLAPGIAGKFRLYNRWGSEIFSVPFTDNWRPLSGGIAAGIYYYQLDYPGCKSYRGMLHIIKGDE
jgi:hypothetical protein